MQKQLQKPTSPFSINAISSMQTNSNSKNANLANIYPMTITPISSVGVSRKINYGGSNVNNTNNNNNNNSQPITNSNNSKNNPNFNVQNLNSSSQLVIGSIFNSSNHSSTSNNNNNSNLNSAYNTPANNSSNKNTLQLLNGTSSSNNSRIGFFRNSSDKDQDTRSWGNTINLINTNNNINNVNNVDSMTNSRGDSRSKRKIFAKAESGGQPQNNSMASNVELMQQMMRVTDISKYLYADVNRNPEYQRYASILKL